MLFLERGCAGRVADVSGEIQISHDNLEYLSDQSTDDLAKTGIDVIGNLPRPYLENVHLERIDPEKLLICIDSADTNSSVVVAMRTGTSIAIFWPSPRGA